jgi:hypothetical protein
MRILAVIRVLGWHRLPALVIVLVGVLTGLGVRVLLGDRGSTALAPSAEPSATHTAVTIPTAESIPEGPTSAAPRTMDLKTGVATPSPALSPDADDALGPPTYSGNALATARVNNLNVRLEPRIAAPPLTWSGEPIRLRSGERLLVLRDAVPVDGHWWLMVGVLPAPPELLWAPALVGWAAAGTASDPWIVEDYASCPDATPTSTQLLALSRLERYGCYRTGPITFEAFPGSIPEDAGLGGWCEPDFGIPRWLICDNINYNWVSADRLGGWQLQLFFDPATGVEPTGLVMEGTDPAPLRITGHFDDPASSECVPADAEAYDAAAGRLNCALRFVVERVER